MTAIIATNIKTLSMSIHAKTIPDLLAVATSKARVINSE